jgi:metal-dependent amidase/aminoacylase/carboxypeptidase family protein
MGETQTPSMEINASLSGFIYKKLHFKGQAAHAAVMPHLGINALNAQILTQNAYALLRETFLEDDRIRLHLITTNGGHSVNSVPSDTILEGYVRSINPDKLLELNSKLNHIATHCAQALDATVEIEDRMGYMPLHQSRDLSALLLPYIQELIPEKNIVDHQKSFAAGDMGDLSLFKPTIQLGFSGCKGLVHGKNFCMANSDEALVYPAYVLLSTIEEIFNHPAKLESIVKDYKTQVTLDDYRKIHKV